MRIRTTIQGICRAHMNFINPYNNYSLISFIGNGFQILHMECAVKDTPAKGEELYLTVCPEAIFHSILTRANTRCPVYWEIPLYKRVILEEFTFTYIQYDMLYLLK